MKNVWRKERGIKKAYCLFASLLSFGLWSLWSPDSSSKQGQLPSFGSRWSHVFFFCMLFASDHSMRLAGIGLIHSVFVVRKTTNRCTLGLEVNKSFQDRRFKSESSHKSLAFKLSLSDFVQMSRFMTPVWLKSLLVNSSKREKKKKCKKKQPTEAVWSVRLAC